MLTIFNHLFCIRGKKRKGEKPMYTKEEAEIMKSLVLCIRNLRNDNNHSQNVFAEKTNYEREHIAKVETGKRNLTLKYILRTIIAYKIPIKDLFKDV